MAKLRRDYSSDPMIGYQNINYIRNKIVQLTYIGKASPKEILCIDETKLISSFPNVKVHLLDYQFHPFRRNRNFSGGGNIVNIRNGITAKRLTVYKTHNTESICVEISI